MQPALTDDLLDLRKAVLKGAVWRSVPFGASGAAAAGTSTRPPQAQPQGAEVDPSMVAAAAVAGSWLERQAERQACCQDWHEGAALNMPHTVAGARLGAVLSVVEGAIDTQIKALEDEVADSPARGSYTREHMQSWLRAAQEKAALAEHRAATAEAAAASHTVEVRSLIATLEKERVEANRARAQLLSVSVENESLRSTCSALAQDAPRSGCGECGGSACSSTGVRNAGLSDRTDFVATVPATDAECTRDTVGVEGAGLIASRDGSHQECASWDDGTGAILPPADALSACSASNIAVAAVTPAHDKMPNMAECGGDEDAPETTATATPLLECTHASSALTWPSIAASRWGSSLPETTELHKESICGESAREDKGVEDPLSNARPAVVREEDGDEAMHHMGKAAMAVAYDVAHEAAGSPAVPATARVTPLAATPPPPPACLMTEAQATARGMAEVAVQTTPTMHGPQAEGCGAAGKGATNVGTGTEPGCAVPLSYSELVEASAAHTVPANASLSSAWVCLRKLQASMLLSEQLLAVDPPVVAENVSAGGGAGGGKGSGAYGEHDEMLRRAVSLAQGSIDADLGVFRNSREVRGEGSPTDAPQQGLEEMLAQLYGNLLQQAAAATAEGVDSSCADDAGRHSAVASGLDPHLDSKPRAGECSSGRLHASLQQRWSLEEAQQAVSRMPIVFAQFSRVAHDLEATRLRNSQQLHHLQVGRGELCRKVGGQLRRMALQRLWSAWRHEVHRSRFERELAEEREGRRRALAALESERTLRLSLADRCETLQAAIADALGRLDVEVSPANKGRDDPEVRQRQVWAQQEKHVDGDVPPMAESTIESRPDRSMATEVQADMSLRWQQEQPCEADGAGKLTSVDVFAIRSTLTMSADSPPSEKILCALPAMHGGVGSEDPASAVHETATPRLESLATFRTVNGASAADAPEHVPSCPKACPGALRSTTASMPVWRSATERPAPPVPYLKPRPAGSCSHDRPRSDFRSGVSRGAESGATTVQLSPAQRLTAQRRSAISEAQRSGPMHFRRKAL